jgi:hypothetical protein
MFDGKVNNRKVAFIGKKKEVVGIDAAKKLRELRALEKKRNSASQNIQKIVRSKIVRARTLAHFRREFDKDSYEGSEKQDVLWNKIAFLTFVYDECKDLDRLLTLLKLTNFHPTIISKLDFFDQFSTKTYVYKKFIGIILDTLSNENVNINLVTNDLIISFLNQINSFSFNKVFSLDVNNNNNNNNMCDSLQKTFLLQVINKECCITIRKLILSQIKNKITFKYNTNDLLRILFGFVFFSIDLDSDEISNAIEVYGNKFFFDNSKSSSIINNIDLISNNSWKAHKFISLMNSGKVYFYFYLHFIYYIKVDAYYNCFK